MPPRFSGTPGDCDFFKRPCRATPVYGGLFLDGQNLTCRVQVVEVCLLVVYFIWIDKAIQKSHKLSLTKSFFGGW